MSVTFSFDDNGMAAGLSGLPAKMLKTGAAALFLQGNLTMTAAKRDTPVDTGALRGSGHVDAPQMSADSATVQLGFGGPSAPYAVYVHENLSARHPSGKAKFLEGAMQVRAAKFASEMAAALSGDLKL